MDRLGGRWRGCGRGGTPMPCGCIPVVGVVGGDRVGSRSPFEGGKALACGLGSGGYVGSLTVNRRAAMLQAALSYVDAGWPIVPGAMPANPPRAGRVWALLGGGPPPECFCGSAQCTAPAAHPLSPDWADQRVTTPQAAAFWWDRPRGSLPNIVLCCGDAFEVWAVPAHVGSRTLELMDGGVAPPAPVALSPSGQWHFFAASDIAERPLRVPAGLGVTRLGAGCWVPAPPSDRGRSGRDRWLVPPRRQLPDAAAVAAALILAAAWSPTGFAQTPPPRTRPAEGTGERHRLLPPRDRPPSVGRPGDAAGAGRTGYHHRLPAATKLGYSQQRIAAMTGQSQPEVSSIIHGRKVMAYDVLSRVCDGLGAPRGYLGLASCTCHTTQPTPSQDEKPA